MFTTIASIIVALGSIASLGYAIWRGYFAPKAKQQKEAAKLIEEGVNEHDASKITAGFDNLNN